MDVNRACWRSAGRIGCLDKVLEVGREVSSREDRQIMEQPALWSDMSDYIEVWKIGVNYTKLLEYIIITMYIISKIDSQLV